MRRTVLCKTYLEVLRRKLPRQTHSTCSRSLVKRHQSKLDGPKSSLKAMVRVRVLYSECCAGVPSKKKTNRNFVGEMRRGAAAAGFTYQGSPSLPKLYILSPDPMVWYYLNSVSLCLSQIYPLFAAQYLHNGVPTRTRAMAENRAHSILDYPTGLYACIYCTSCSSNGSPRCLEANRQQHG